ncbi:MAG: diacylglycerol kinase [Alphaproteobacteria bacterium]|nr:diacylglycerol kinase [Alphaproteobacteria bacterium]
MRIGVIQNPRSHRNRHGVRPVSDGDVEVVAPPTPEALDAALAGFAARGLDVLVIDGGDGTVRDVLSHALTAFGNRMPPVAVMPHGKTNALARDLGLPLNRPLDQAIAALRTGAAQRKQRPVLQVIRPGLPGPALNGFILGIGAFVRATRLARRTHRFGLFDGVAVGASLSAFVAGTLLGTKGSAAAAGEEIALGTDAAAPAVRRRFLILASTLERMPLRMRPFGTLRSGLKLIDVDAPPRRVIRALPLLLSGREAPWLEPSGYRRMQSREVRLTGVDAFVLDGEILHAGGEMILREGPMIDFVTP